MKKRSVKKPSGLSSSKIIFKATDAINLMMYAKSKKDISEAIKFKEKVDWSNEEGLKPVWENFYKEAAKKYLE